MCNRRIKEFIILEKKEYIFEIQSNIARTQGAQERKKWNFLWTDDIINLSLSLEYHFTRESATVAERKASRVIPSITVIYLSINCKGTEEGKKKEEYSTEMLRLFLSIFS